MLILKEWGATINGNYFAEIADVDDSGTRGMFHIHADTKHELRGKLARSGLKPESAKRVLNERELMTKAYIMNKRAGKFREFESRLASLKLSEDERKFRGIGWFADAPREDVATWWGGYTKWTFIRSDGRCKQYVKRHRDGETTICYTVWEMDEFGAKEICESRDVRGCKYVQR